MLPMNRHQMLGWDSGPRRDSRAEAPAQFLDFTAVAGCSSFPAEMLLPGVASPGDLSAGLSSAVRRHGTGMQGSVATAAAHRGHEASHSQCGPVLPHATQLKLARIVRSCGFAPHLGSSCDEGTKVDGDADQVWLDGVDVAYGDSRLCEQDPSHCGRLGRGVFHNSTTQYYLANELPRSSPGSPQHRQRLWFSSMNTEDVRMRTEVTPSLHSHPYTSSMVHHLSASTVEESTSGVPHTSLRTKADEGNLSASCGGSFGGAATLIRLESAASQPSHTCPRLLGEPLRTHRFTEAGLPSQDSSIPCIGGSQSGCRSTVEETATEELFHGQRHRRLQAQERQPCDPTLFRGLRHTGETAVAATRSLPAGSECWTWGAAAAPGFLNSSQKRELHASEKVGVSHRGSMAAVFHALSAQLDREHLTVWRRAAPANGLNKGGEEAADRRLQALGNTLHQMRHHHTSLRPEDVVFESTLSSETGGLQYCVTEEGSFGKVFVGHLACDTNEKVAIKIPAEPMLKIDAGGVIERILNEWKLLSVCKHPNIVDLVGGVIHGPFDVWLITRLVDGGYDLHSRKYSQNPAVRRKIAPSAAIFMCRQLAAVVAFLHENAPQRNKPSVVHRDIKPENIIVDENWCIRLCDFGDAEASVDGCLSRVSGATWSYAPPELLLSCPVDYDTGGLRSGQGIESVEPTAEVFQSDLNDSRADRSSSAGLIFGPKWDIWSMGCVFHEMFGFPNPFHVHVRVDDTPETIHKKLRQKAQERSLIPVIAPQLQGLARNIIASCLNPDPRERPSAVEVYNLWNSGDELLLKDIHIDPFSEREA